MFATHIASCNAVFMIQIVPWNAVLDVTSETQIQVGKKIQKKSFLPIPQM